MSIKKLTNICISFQIISQTVNEEGYGGIIFTVMSNIKKMSFTQWYSISFSGWIPRYVWRHSKQKGVISKLISTVQSTHLRCIFYTRSLFLYFRKLSSLENEKNNATMSLYFHFFLFNYFYYYMYVVMIVFFFTFIHISLHICFSI